MLLSLSPVPFLIVSAWLLLLAAPVVAVERELITTTNATLRVMAANLTGGSQKYEPNSIRIFQGLRPDLVAIQEFNYSNNTPAQIRAFIDTAFGTNFSYFRESGAGYSIPNGVVSRWPIRSAGTWDDALMPDRGFAWAQVDIPGTNDLYLVSIHLKAGTGADATTRSNEAVALRQLVTNNFPANAFIIVAGDMNLQNRSEAALTTLKTILIDAPIPVDQAGNPNTNAGRDRPYDVVLVSASFNTNFVPVVIGAQSFTNGLVFDSRVFTPLSAVAPVQSADSGLNQHMVVLKDFRVSYTVTNRVEVPRPVLVLDRTNSMRWATVAGITYTVERSANLTNWTSAAQFTATGTNASYTNILTAAPFQFYRVSF